MTNKMSSDGSTALYYELPVNSRELQDLISFRDMNAQMGEIFRATYRYGKVEHSDKMRDIKKIIFYANAELKRLTMLQAAEAIMQKPATEYFIIRNSQIEERSRQLIQGGIIQGPFDSIVEARKQDGYFEDSLICTMDEDCVITELAQWTGHGKRWIEIKS